MVREEERLRKLRAEKEEFAVRESERQQVSNSDVRKPKFMKIREMRESKDIDDYLPREAYDALRGPRYREDARSGKYIKLLPVQRHWTS